MHETIKTNHDQILHLQLHGKAQSLRAQFVLYGNNGGPGLLVTKARTQDAKNKYLAFVYNKQQSNNGLAKYSHKRDQSRATMKINILSCQNQLEQLQQFFNSTRQYNHPTLPTATSNSTQAAIDLQIDHVNTNAIVTRLKSMQQL